MKPQHISGAKIFVSFWSAKAASWQPANSLTGRARRSPTATRLTICRSTTSNPPVKAFLSHEWQLTGEDALEYLSVVFPDGRHDEILFCILLLTVFKRRLPAETWPEVEMWLEHIDHWVVCDQLAINIAGRLVLADKSRWKALQLWAQSPNEWQRRFAVTTAGIVRNKGGRKSKDVLKLIDPLMNDASTHVQNVVAWAIRQVAGENEHLAVNFLKKWKGRCDHEIFREATLRLSPDAKITVMKAKSHHA